MPSGTAAEPTWEHNEHSSIDDVKVWAFEASSDADCASGAVAGTSRTCPPLQTSIHPGDEPAAATVPAKSGMTACSSSASAAASDTFQRTADGKTIRGSIGSRIRRDKGATRDKVPRAPGSGRQHRLGLVAAAAIKYLFFHPTGRDRRSSRDIDRGPGNPGP